MVLVLLVELRWCSREHLHVVGLHLITTFTSFEDLNLPILSHIDDSQRILKRLTSCDLSKVFLLFV